MQTVNQLLRVKGSQIFSVAPTDSVRQCHRNHGGSACRCASGHEIRGPCVGIISERDYARKVILKNRSSHDTPVADIMSSPPVTVEPTDTVHHCMELMTEGRFRHLPVVDSGRVLGMLSIGDLVKAVIEEQTRQKIEQLERYIAG